MVLPGTKCTHVRQVSPGGPLGIWPETRFSSRSAPPQSGPMRAKGTRNSAHTPAELCSERAPVWGRTGPGPDISRKSANSTCPGPVRPGPRLLFPGDFLAPLQSESVLVLERFSGGPKLENSTKAQPMLIMFCDRGASHFRIWVQVLKLSRSVARSSKLLSYLATCVLNLGNKPKQLQT